MNAPTIIKDQKPKISVADLFHLIEQGVIDPEARFELVEGEIVATSPQGPLHQNMQRWLHLKLTIALADRFWVAPGSTLILPEFSAVDPDICVYPLRVATTDLTGEKVTLVVEISVSSRNYDLGRKAGLYARMGVNELWVVDAGGRETHVHRGASADGWRQILRVPFDAHLALDAAPGLALRLADAG